MLRLFSAILLVTIGLQCNRTPNIRHDEYQKLRSDYPLLPPDAKIETVLSHLADSLMRVYDIPGLQLSLICHGMQIYTLSQGYADVESRTPVTDSSLFRIASLSKVITHTAILQLVQTSQLSLEQLVFGGDKPLLNYLEHSPQNTRYNQITVKHLLLHTSGLENTPNDAMFQDPALTADELIEQTLACRTPQAEPGTRYSYSNFGYLLLGKIIAEVSGMSYPEYVKNAIFKPCGVQNMCMAQNMLPEKAPNEVSYYTDEPLQPHDFNVNRLGAAGGWLGHSTDLCRFLARIDRQTSIEDLISLETMDVYYLRYPTWVHTGSLPGSTSIICRLNDHLGFCLLMNTRSSKLTENELDRIKNEWQNRLANLFSDSLFNKKNKITR